MHKTLGLRDPAASFPLSTGVDDTGDRRQANRAIAVSAIGLGQRRRLTCHPAIVAE